jgi:glycine cleavage system H protein
VAGEFFQDRGLDVHGSRRYLPSALKSTVQYKRATFVTRLPVDYLYTASHSWLMPAGERAASMGLWRVGYTKFALRMLGDLVDVQFESQPGAEFQTGDILGTIEGFKAISDIYGVGVGRFAGANPDLNHSLTQVVENPYELGWLYEFSGSPDSRSMDVDGYRALLDATIDRILEKQQGTTS